VAFARPTAEQRQAQRAAERAANLQALATVPARSLHPGTYTGGTTAAAPKTEPKRCPALLAMAAGRPCLLLIPGICNHRIDSTVACHSNLSIHGKGKSRKADDHYSVWGCAACHRWLDTGGALAAVTEVAFMTAHARQVLAWRQVAADPGEPEKFRRAARWALEHLNATPIGSES
jgi:hypothetical protein